MIRKWIIRWLISVVVLGIFALVAYNYLYSKASDGMRAEVLKIVDEMALESQWRPEVRRLIEEAHEEAFAAALNIREQLGRKFDAKRYIDELFDRVVAYAREEGRDRLADTVERERHAFSLDVSEH